MWLICDNEEFLSPLPIRTEKANRDRAQCPTPIALLKEGATTASPLFGPNISRPFESIYGPNKESLVAQTTLYVEFNPLKQEPVDKNK